MSYENWKYILGIFSFQNSVFNSIFVIKLTTFSLFSRNVWLLGFFFSFLKQSPTAYLDFSVFLTFQFFFFFFETISNGRTEWWVPNGWVWRNCDILSDKWLKLNEEWWLMTQKIPKNSKQLLILLTYFWSYILILFFFFIFPTK